MKNVDEEVKAQDQKERRNLKLSDYKNAMQRIKDSTGVSDVNEIIQKFLTQNDTLNNLNELKQENERKIMMLNDDKTEIKKQLERLRFEGVEAMTRKQIEEVERNCVVAEVKYERNKDRLERINGVLVNTKAGVEHLSDKLYEVKLEGKPDLQVSYEKLDEALSVIEIKTGKL